jgi:uncharacterized membrane protein
METQEATDKIETVIENSERMLSVLSGAAMLYHEFKKDGPASKIKLGLAGYLIYRGLSGRCALSDKTGINPSIVSGLSHFL